MKLEKKSYEAPKLEVHGTVTELTQSGGGNQTDVPVGTPVNGNVNNVIGTHM
jgi:hypothetical protein